MAEPEGPGKHRPRVCDTLSLADLGDTIGFREPGKDVYGFELTSEGFYNRAAVFTPELEEPEWDIKLKIQRQCVSIESGRLTRIDNQGAMLVSYVPNRKLEVTGQLHFYIIGTQKGVENPHLKAVTALPQDSTYLTKPPIGSIIYLELLLGDEIPKDFITVFPGLSLKWAAPSLVGIQITNPNGKAVARLAHKEEGISIKTEDIISINQINFYPNLGFVRLLFTTLPYLNCV